MIFIIRIIKLLTLVVIRINILRKFRFIKFQKNLEINNFDFRFSHLNIKENKLLLDYFQIEDSLPNKKLLSILRRYKKSVVFYDILIDFILKNNIQLKGILLLEKCANWTTDRDFKEFLSLVIEEINYSNINQDKKVVLHDENKPHGQLIENKLFENFNFFVNKQMYFYVLILAKKTIFHNFSKDVFNIIDLAIHKTESFNEGILLFENIRVEFPQNEAEIYFNDLIANYKNRLHEKSLQKFERIKAVSKIESLKKTIKRSSLNVKEEKYPELKTLIERKFSDFVDEGNQYIKSEIESYSNIILRSRFKEGNISYNELLNHSQWKLKRIKILSRDKGRCRNCSVQNNLQIHHEYYIIDFLPWEYNDDALITFCRKCHIDWHEKNKNIYYVMKNGKIFNTKEFRCSKCDGSGYIHEYKYYKDGVCFDCNGYGFYW